MFKYLYISLLALIFTACSMQPKLNLDEKELIQSSFKDYEKSDKKSFEKLDSSDFILDESLKKIVNLALLNNKDLNIALLKIDRAKALYGIETSKLFPSVNANGSLNRSDRNNNISSNYEANLAASFELDLFGKNQSLNLAAKNSFLATKYAYNSTKLVLISQTISSYFNLLSNIENRNLATKILENLNEVYTLTSKKYSIGASSKDEMLASLASLKEMENRILDFENEIEKSINALELLISSKLPDDILKNSFLDSLYLKSLDYNIDSNVLLNRPDIKEYEFKLKEKNANIGAARAAFFPTISLTASTGYASSSLDGLFNSNNSFWEFRPSITLPIFSAGANIKRLKYSKVEQEIALKEYQRSIQTAFKEVNDALAIRKNIDLKVKNHKELLEALENSYNIALNSYKIGHGSYLNMLISQRAFINAKINHTNLYKDELENRVLLFKVLGGELN
ncbi:efflux transporter outer membrane subunit [Aliarcobacter skirrowii]|mgnify:CR=1 FL=1|uniref:RND family efflux system, outer membrane channel protein, TolC family n=1 Tax=Aliarcobacter skirrowii CCUG 10374 TaxID=1032239 RepID=A0AAD0ST24_9BACT|nr:TolC family protein [Aliarcobacter skirrowii]AXX85755.1 RND family efflux system, outer membrane channel protein, TolC family [Aliarcobacter skirrowii CCUG 10374]KAB0622003.1 TolC family protein [Aliarcobacter skirrowii CCUG 10374]RXI27253.1 TolC family protein [Aliarcobacter skirrowii CCUG 10374]SUU95709.1 Probable efflux pump outer membrane protein ttgC precursor [Aliarcobacter skirrowii]